MRGEIWGLPGPNFSRVRDMGFGGQGVFARLHFLTRHLKSRTSSHVVLEHYYQAFPLFDCSKVSHSEYS